MRTVAIATDALRRSRADLIARLVGFIMSHSYSDPTKKLGAVVENECHICITFVGSNVQTHCHVGPSVRNDIPRTFQVYGISPSVRKVLGIRRLHIQ